jgi:hypothetical protein
MLALGSALVVTSAYHLGYADFRGLKLLRASIGNAIATVPTLLSGNPVASPLAHILLHVTAVIHNPQSDLFLPPHELRSVQSAGIEGALEAASDGWPDRDTVNLVRDALRPFLIRPKVLGGDIRPLAGNFVMIDGGPITVFLAHLRRDSVRVSVGQRVRTGDVSGEVGNSGNSLAPHVHVQVMDGPDPLQARILPFRLHRYERWRGEAWEPMREAIPTAGERIRRML